MNKFFLIGGLVVLFMSTLWIGAEVLKVFVHMNYEIQHLKCQKEEAAK